MKIFKITCLLGILSFLPASIVNGTAAIERDIASLYQQGVLNNARYNNCKDTRRKVIQYDIDSLNTEIYYCNYDINEYNEHLRQLDSDMTYCKEKRTELDGELAVLMCLDDLEDPTAKSRIANLKREISRNENSIEKCESEISKYFSKLSKCYSRKENLERELRQKQLELKRS